MPIYWDNDCSGLALPSWMDDNSGVFETRMAQLVLLLRESGLARLRALVADAGGGPILVPSGRGYRTMRITSPLDICPKADGWLRVSCDICFEPAAAPAYEHAG
jgi:hypothetical protein